MRRAIKTMAVATPLCASLLVTSGCASLISGSHDDILVKTDPAGADCTVFQGATVRGHVNPTPGGITVPRSYDDILVRCEKDGYTAAEVSNTSGLNGWVFGNIIFGLIGGPIGAIVDTSTSNATSYSPETYVSLAKADKAPAPVGPEPDKGTSVAALSGRGEMTTTGSPE